jgi:hypothetical protein
VGVSRGGSVGQRYVIGQVTAAAALVGSLNRHLDTVAVASMGPPAGRSGSGMIVKLCVRWVAGSSRKHA